MSHLCITAQPTSAPSCPRRQAGTAPCQLHRRSPVPPLNWPLQLAEFIQRNHDQLDKAAIGEYFGHHEELQIRVMHAFVDLQRFQGLTIDVALRNLMDEFRWVELAAGYAGAAAGSACCVMLPAHPPAHPPAPHTRPCALCRLPGEAQKIDRIMEKFAERYCNDNPGLFRTAEGAYLLAFATIMLNTDAHNPMAERRLGKADFVAMNYEQVGVGDGLRWLWDQDVLGWICQGY
jgi:hypothetical protein